MIPRTESRTLAMHCLYSVELGGSVLKRLEDPFALEIVQGWENHRVEIDTAIQKASPNWRIERLSKVDLSILRAGVFELLFTTTERAIVINEWVEIAKKFGSEESSGFVNGVMDHIISP